MDNSWLIKRFSLVWNSFIRRRTAPAPCMMQALYCPSPRYYLVGKSELFLKSLSPEVKAFSEGGSALLPLSGSDVDSSVLGQYKQYWALDEQFLQPSDCRGDMLPSHAMAPGWNKSLFKVMTSLFFLFCFATVPALCSWELLWQCAITAPSACSPPGTGCRRGRG